MNVLNKKMSYHKKKLGEICQFIGGGTPSKNNPIYWNGIIPWASIKDMKGNYLLKTSDFISEEGLNNSATNLARKGELIIATRINPGRPIITKIDTSINQDLKIVRPKINCDIKYLYYAFLNYENDILKLSSGTTVLGIRLEILNSISIPLPPAKTQQLIVSKIEELFSELDKGIEELKKVQEQLKTYRQSVLKWAFEGRLTNENVVDGVLPMSWVLIDLKEVCLIKRGKSKHRPRNAPELYGGNYPFIQTGDIRNANGRYIKTFNQTYSDFGLLQSKLWTKGTLCITIAANIGETAILDFDACFPDSVVGIVSNCEILNNKYLNYFFISFKQKLGELAPATAQKNINVEILEKIKIPLAKIEEQHKIVQEIECRLSVADKMEETVKTSLLQAESLRQSILKKAFSGELV